MTRYTVTRCTRRRDDKFMVFYKMPGAVTGSATSDVAIPEGKSVAILNGRVVMRGCE